MAVIQLQYLSRALFRTVPVSVYLPVDRLSLEGYRMAPGERFKTLYLLHGLLGDHTDWLVNTRLRRYAEEKNLAVVMPSGDNSFYVNGVVPNNDYGVFIGRELVEITRKMFPLSDRREDTFIAGLSMGGFGALRNGIVYADTFGYIAGLSSAVHILEEDPENVRGEHLVFGDRAAARASDKNPYIALRHRLSTGGELPEFYMACGLSDSLMDANRRLRDELLRAGAHVTWDEQPGGHDWDFWDMEIQKVLDWLPLQEDGGSIGSGNVR